MSRLITIFLVGSFSLPTFASNDYATEMSQGDYYQDEHYQSNDYRRPIKKRKSKKLTPFNNWNKSMRRWSKGEGAWDNWRDWKNSGNTKQPWNMFGNAMGDMTADMMGEVVADIDFEIWLEVNFEAEMWFDMDQQEKFDVFNFWQQKVEPHYDYSNTYQNDYQQRNQGYGGGSYYEYPANRY